MDPTDLKEVVKMIKNEEDGPFLSKIIHTQTKTMLLGSNMHVMMQTLENGDRPCLPHLSIMNTYTENIHREQVSCDLGEESNTALVTITRGVMIAQVMGAIAIP